MRFRILVAIVILFAFRTQAQTFESEVDLKDIIESIAENLPEEYDMTDFVDILDHFRKHPINLNQTSPDELKKMVFLSPLQINNFFNHLNENGDFLDVLELQAIDGFDVNTVKCLLPFVTLNKKSGYENFSFKNLLNLGENDLLIRYAQNLEQQKGFRDLPGNRYLGSPEKIQTRYRYHYGEIVSAAITIEKDAGERLFQKPFDFLSGNVSVQKLGKIKKAVIGDYTLQFGQGLTMWSGLAFGKGPDVTSIAKKDLGLRPYTSANEYFFLRGASATIKLLKNFDLTPFVSLKRLDASQTLDNDGNRVQATINQTGLHRTPSELENKGVLSQHIFGGAIQYNNNDLSFGAIAYHSKYGNRFITQSALYDQFSFTGNALTNIGFSYNYTYKNIYFFGEGGKSLSAGLAYVNGVLISLSSTVSVALSYRHYDANYHSFFNQAIAESSEAINERGFYAGLNLVPNKHWSFSVYGDYFKFPWLKYLVDAPSKGFEVLSQSIYTPSKTLKILLRFKTENKQQNTNLDLPIHQLDDVKKEGYRAEINWQLNKEWLCQNRVEISQYKKGANNSEFGYLVYQDVSYGPKLSKVKGNLRLAYFNTPSYNSRIYAYEDDVLYSFAFGMYSGKGIRTYFNLKYNLNKKLNIWARYGMFIYRNVETVGTYLDEIQGNKKSEIKFQLRYQF